MPRSTTRFAIASLAGIAALAGCGDDQPDTLPWPERPATLAEHDDPAAATTVDILTMGIRAAGAEFDLESREILELGDNDREAVIDAYGAQLEGWDQTDAPADTIGRAWAHGDQRFVVMIADVAGETLVITVGSTVDD